MCDDTSFYFLFSCLWLQNLLKSINSHLKPEISMRKTTGTDDPATPVGSLSSSSPLHPWPGQSVVRVRPRPLFLNNSNPRDFVLKRALQCDDGMGSPLSASDFNYKIPSLHNTSQQERTDYLHTLVDLFIPSADDLSDCDDSSSTSLPRLKKLKMRPAPRGPEIFSASLENRDLGVFSGFRIT